MLIPEGRLAGLDPDYLEEAAPRGKHCAALLCASNIVVGRSGRDSIGKFPAESFTCDSLCDARVPFLSGITIKKKFYKSQDMIYEHEFLTIHCHKYKHTEKKCLLTF